MVRIFRPYVCAVVRCLVTKHASLYFLYYFGIFILLLLFLNRHLLRCPSHPHCSIFEQARRRQGNCNTCSERSNQPANQRKWMATP